MALLDAAASTVPHDRLSVASFDHGTGPAATAALEHVERVACRLGIHFVPARTLEPLVGEASFRDARWSFLRSVAAETGAVVATAHTEDDQVETILMRVLRDAGARGLAGLYAACDVLRPLVRLSRRDLVRYARAQGLTWVEDPSNTSRAYLRNRVRHDLLPALRHARPTVDRELLAIGRKAARWRADLEATAVREIAPRLHANGLDVVAERLANRSVDELRILWPALVAQLGTALDRRGTVRLAEFTISGRVGSRIQLSGGWEVVRSRTAFQLRACGGSDPAAEQLTLSDTTAWGQWSFRPASEIEHDDGWSAWLPTDEPLSVRGWRAGDVMASHTGSRRKVKYFLSDAGVTGHERTTWPVILAGDEIVWIPGVRRSDAATVRSGRPGLPFICEYSNR